MPRLPVVMFGEADRLVGILDARFLAASGDAEGALALLDDVGRPAGQSYSTSAPMMQPLVEGRLLRAQLLEALGREEERGTLWDSFAEDYVFGIGYMGLGREAVPAGRQGLPARRAGMSTRPPSR